MPNSIAFLVLALWPLVMLVLFKRLPVGRALIWSFLGGYLLLPPHPTAFDFPLMPPLNKLTLPNMMAVIYVIFVANEKIEFWPRSGLGKTLMATFILSPIFTVLNNPEPVLFATGGLRGLYARDIIALVINQAILLSGFILARQFLRSQDDLRDLLLALVVAGLFYSFPILLEVRLSPQLNIWIYGYFQHVFEQTMRGGGFRALVFLEHGIWASMLIMMSLASAIILWRADIGKSRSWFMIAAVFLAGVLVLNKTLGPLVYAIFLISLVVLTSWKLQTRVAVLLAALALAYPLAKGANLVPEERILQVASAVSEERSFSLKFRFDNENLLYERAIEKPLFGWGSWGRNQLHDPITGTSLAVTDGRWIIAVGMFGWVGFLAEFGLLALPIFMFARASSQNEKGIKKQWKSEIHASIPVQKEQKERVIEHVVTPIGGGLALLLSLNLIDLLPNATLTPITWLLAGALLGYSESLRETSKDIGIKRKKSVLDAPNRVHVSARTRTIL
ncbi:hypothetical protein [Cognatishimia activa]|uniref:hypothetical protein n=1 Tax=Cognatishimia activa TaxID=1715691 RepID=UPI002230FB54|nr:hypothetical protein [Cognatishimia activa]UZD91700.1 hypothetical protein M0D42_03520 [Cognatishimia activa]